MRKIRRQAAALLACAVLSANTRMPLPAFCGRSPQKASVLAFAEQVMQQMTPAPGNAFSELTYSAGSEALLLDGKPTGTEAAGFRIENGRLLADAAALGIAGAGTTVTPEQAAALAGCTVRYSDGNVTVTSPFQSGVLLVRANGSFDPCGAVSVSAPFDGLYVLSYPSAAASYHACQVLSADENVIFAEPNSTVYAAEAAQMPEEGNWGYEVIGADAFQADYLQDSDTEVRVAVIDTGIYAAHEWFSGRLDAAGASFCEEDGGSVADLHSHGTHCAGIICASTTDCVKILPVKALSSDGYGSVLSIYCALLYALEQQADLVSMSFNGAGYSLLVADAVKRLSEQDIPCVVSAGNNAGDCLYYEPANLDEVIVVSAVKKTASGDSVQYSRASFSNSGESVDFCAPGSGIVSAGITAPDALTEKSGTSMAAPFAAACAANLLQYDNTLTKDEIYRLLKNNAQDLGDAGFDRDFGWGMVDLRDFTFSEIGCAMPEAEPQGGVYSGVQQVQLSCKTDGASVYYTLDGTIPTAETGILYDGNPVTVSRDTALRAAAFNANGGSKILHADYRLECAAPEPSPAPGSYDSAVSVRLTAGDGAAIYYTTDGTSPGKEQGMLYDGGELVFSETTVLRAAAVIGDCVSDELNAAYVIGGKGAEALFSVENGVLTDYFGTFASIDLPSLLPDTPLNAVGENVFAGDTNLKEIVLPDSVRVIGASAFAGCTALQSVTANGAETIGSGAFADCAALSALQSDPAKWSRIGAECFAGSGICGDLELDALESLGENAFADTAGLRSVRLPETVTLLPDGVLRGSALESLSAPAAVEIGAAALADTAHLRELALPFAEITQIGASAFAHCPLGAAGVTDPVFSSAEAVGAGAFADAVCNTLTFPALKIVTEDAFSSLSAVMLYLPAAEILCENAVSFSETNCAGVCVGDKLRKLADGSFSGAENAAVFAGPADSPLRAAAAGYGVKYLSAPAVYVPQTEFCFAAGHAEQLFAYPVGEGVSLQWSFGSGQIAAHDRFSVIPAQAQEGSAVYTVTAVQEGTAAGVSETITVQTVLPAETGVVQNVNIPVPVLWEQQAIFAEYRFTAPETGEYYIFPEDSSTAVTLQYGEETVFQHGSGTAPEQIRPLRMQTGESVAILMRRTQEIPYSVLAVCDRAPQQSVCGGSLSAEHTVFAAGTAVPAISAALRLPDASGEEHALTENTDYLAFPIVYENGQTGEIAACGTGDYCGICREPLVLYNELRTDKSQEIQSFSGTRWFRLIPAQSGEYTILTDTAAEMLAHPAQSDALRCDGKLVLYQNDMSVLKRFDSSGTRGSAWVSAYLDAGKSYYISVSSANAEQQSLCVRAFLGNQQGNLMLADILIPDSAVYQFQPYEPDCRVTLRDGTPLTAGTDYVCILRDHALPGKMTILLHGIGVYYGTSVWQLTVTDPAAWPVTAELQTDEPLQLPELTGVYRFNLESPAVLRLTADDENAALQYLIRKAEDANRTECIRKQDTAPDTAFSLPAGTFEMLLFSDRLCSVCLQTVQQQTSLADAVIQTEDLYADGNLLRPLLTVRLDGRCLAEEQDYTLSWDMPVRECGLYRVTVTGCGDYTDTRTVWFRVRPQQEQSHSAAETHENTVTVTGPGEAFMMQWVPQKAHYCIRKTDLQNEIITVLDAYGNPAAVCSGIGYQFAECTVRIGEQYYIRAEYLSRESTGSFTFSLLSDYALLTDCSLLMQETVPFVQNGEVPAFRLTDDAYLLQEGKDYIVRVSGDSCAAGRAEIMLEGIGRYVGTACAAYYQYPALADAKQRLKPVTLQAGAVKTEKRGLPASERLYQFTAQKTDRYYLHLPDSESDGVCALVYDSSGAVLPMQTIMLDLQAGDTISVLCITDWLESDYGEDDRFEVMVSYQPPALTYAAEGFGWLLDGGTAELTAVPDTLTGLHLPEEITEPESGLTFSFSGISGDLTEQLAAQRVIYGAEGGAVEKFCRQHGLCFVPENAECTVPGDVNGDDAFTAEDVTVLLRFLAECEGMTLSSSALECADTNRDGLLTLTDVLSIRVDASSQ